MLAHGYKRCFWKANGDLDCSGQNSFNNRQERPQPFKMFSSCQELGYNCDDPYNNSYNQQSRQYENIGGGNMDYSNWQNPDGGFYDEFRQSGGSDPATFYANQGPAASVSYRPDDPRFANRVQCLYSSCDYDRVPKCREPSGPRIAAGGFSSDAQWVSPEYHQPPRDSDTPRNNFNHNLDNRHFNPEQKYATYYSRKSQRGGSGFKSIRHNGKKGRFAQSKLPKAFYKKRSRQNGGGYRNSYNNSTGYASQNNHSGSLIPYGSRNNTLLATTNISPGFSDRLPTQYTKDEFLHQKYGNTNGNNYNYNQVAGGFNTGQSNMYSNNPYNSAISYNYPAQCYGGSQGGNYPVSGGYYGNDYNFGPVPTDMTSTQWSQDLSYRDGSNIIPAQAQYENMLSGYKQNDTYGQTNFDYVGQMQQGWNRISNDRDCSTCQQGGNNYNFSQYGGADATFAGVSQPQSTALVTPPFYSKWQCPNGTVIKPDPMDSVVGHRDCEGNPNLTLNIGNDLREAFETPLFQGGGNSSNDGYSQYSPSYNMTIQQDWQNLQPKHVQSRASLQLGGGPRAYDSNCQALVSSNVMPSNSGQPWGAPVQTVQPPAYQAYEIPYDQQGVAPRQVMWVPKVRSKLRVLSRELGAPYLIDKNANGFAIWNQSCLNQVYAGIFKRVELHDEMIPCEKPFKHYRNLYAWVRLDVSPDQLEKLQVISPNITYDMTKRWLCVSGSSMRSNLAITTLICMYLKNKLSLNQIQGYKLQKKYLMALIPKSGMYHPGAKSTYVKTIKSMT